jgi:hypothetical protein
VADGREAVISGVIQLKYKDRGALHWHFAEEPGSRYREKARLGEPPQPVEKIIAGGHVEKRLQALFLLPRLRESPRDRLDANGDAAARMDNSIRGPQCPLSTLII